MSDTFAREGRKPTRRNPLPPATLHRAGIADVQPGVVNPQHLGEIGSRAVTLDRVVEGFRQSATASFTAGGATATPASWGAPANPDRLAVHIGPTDEPLLLLAWLYLGWANGSGANFHGKTCLTLADGPIGTLGSGGSVYQRTSANPSRYFPNDGNTYQMAHHAIIAVPVLDNADWHLTWSVQTDGAIRASQVVNRQHLMCFATAPSGVDPNTEADSGLV